MTFMQYSIQPKNYTPMFDMVPHSQVLRCPPLLYGATLSGSALSTGSTLAYGAALSSLAMSALTISMVSRCLVPRFQSPHFMQATQCKNADFVAIAARLIDVTVLTFIIHVHWLPVAQVGWLGPKVGGHLAAFTFCLCIG